MTRSVDHVGLSDFRSFGTGSSSRENGKGKENTTERDFERERLNFGDTRRHYPHRTAPLTADDDADQRAKSALIPSTAIAPAQPLFSLHLLQLCSF